MICAYYSEQSERRVYLTETRHAVAHLAIPEGILGMTISLFTSARLLCNCSLFTNYEELFPPIGIQFQQKIRRSFLNTVKFKVAIVGNAKLRNTVAPNRLIQYFIHVHNTVSEI